MRIQTLFKGQWEKWEKFTGANCRLSTFYRPDRSQEQLCQTKIPQLYSKDLKLNHRYDHLKNDAIYTKPVYFCK